MSDAISRIAQGGNSAAYAEFLRRRDVGVGKENPIYMPVPVKEKDATTGPRVEAIPVSKPEGPDAGERKRQRVELEAQLPPRVEGSCPESVAKRVDEFLDRVKASGRRFNQSLRGNREFSNPYILNKVVESFDIKQYGSNFPTGEPNFPPLDLFCV